MAGASAGWSIAVSLSSLDALEEDRDQFVALLCGQVDIDTSPELHPQSQSQPNERFPKFLQGQLQFVNEIPA